MPEPEFTVEVEIRQGPVWRCWPPSRWFKLETVWTPARLRASRGKLAFMNADSGQGVTFCNEAIDGYVACKPKQRWWSRFLPLPHLDGLRVSRSPGESLLCWECPVEAFRCLDDGNSAAVEPPAGFDGDTILFRIRAESPHTLQQLEESWRGNRDSQRA